ncbi:hypothetical protein LY78DRAFT_288444 [Colletotrichum sublineola]|nr:hypothetical protein LY78DRAFT_288444 [Colletotrichum sublineola]
MVLVATRAFGPESSPTPLEPLTLKWRVEPDEELLVRVEGVCESSVRVTRGRGLGQIVVVNLDVVAEAREERDCGCGEGNELNSPIFTIFVIFPLRGSPENCKKRAQTSSMGVSSSGLHGEATAQYTHLRRSGWISQGPNSYVPRRASSVMQYRGLFSFVITEHGLSPCRQAAGCSEAKGNKADTTRGQRGPRGGTY